MSEDDRDEQEDCMHGIWPASFCTLCNGAERRAELKAQTVVARFSSKFDESRLSCGHTVYQGERMAKLESGAYVCGRCA